MTNLLHLLLFTPLIFTSLQGQSSMEQSGVVTIRDPSTETRAPNQHKEYEPYGEPKIEGGSLKFAKKFTGKELDDSTGLYDYAARQYDPKLGRFITPDTVDPKLPNPQTLNRYSYTLNNPLKYTDPTGHYVESPSDWLSASMSFDEFQQNPSFVSGLALGWGIFALATPGVPGFGGYTIKGTKGLAKLGDAMSASKIVDKAGDTGKVVKQINKEKSIVIGESMDRVKPKAKELQAEWYEPKPKVFNNPDISVEQKLRNDVSWYRRKIKEGYKVYDYGLDPYRKGKRGIFYKEENRFTRKWLKEGRLNKENYKNIK